MRMLTATSRTVLETLRDVAKATPVPYLSEAAGLALSIFDLVERAHGNKEDLSSLASECVSIVYIINGAFDNPVQEFPDDLRRDLEKVRDTLSAIQKFAQKQAARRFVPRMIMGRKDAEDIKTYQGKLAQAMLTFNFQSNIEQRKILHGLASSIKSPISPSNPNLERGSLPSTPQSSSINNSMSVFSNASLANMSPGAITISNTTGDSHSVHNSNNSRVFNSGNVWNTNVVNPGNAYSNGYGATTYATEPTRARHYSYPLNVNGDRVDSQWGDQNPFPFLVSSQSYRSGNIDPAASYRVFHPPHG